MPTNLPAEYYDAEERFKAAATPEERVARLEDMLSTIPKHKGTDHLRADLRRKLSRLKEEAARPQKGAARQISPFHIEREGAGQVALLGPPNSGKSSLLVALTNAEPEVAPFPFTTWTPTPGMMAVEDIQVQLVDLPPLSEEYVEPQMLDLVRRADLVLLVLDIQGYPIQELEDTLDLLAQNRIAPVDYRPRYAEEARPPLFVPLLVVVNKVDDELWDEEFSVLCELLPGELPILPLSAQSGRGVEAFKWTLFDRLEIMRVYSKPPRQEPDLSRPFVLPRGATVEQFAAKVHRDFAEQLKTARVWGTGVYDGQPVGRDHALHDGDVVELHI
ncbi:MAG: TGS domain-containing protein [Candidatus Promineifilaceae bacterium]|nr:TGS domain-containing protein [Candidatus Promineifilaceae bacterium]